MQVKTPLHLYKYLMRGVQKLPPDAHSYYKHHIRMGFRSHQDEDDTDRIQQIINRAIEDAEWILTKYANKEKKK